MTLGRTLHPIPAPLYDPAREHDACGVGFVASLRRNGSPELVSAALEALAALAHRGGVAADALTGDGAGISLPLPPRFLDGIAVESGISPAPGRLAVGMVFLPPQPSAAARAREHLEVELAQAGLRPLGWREVPVRRDLLAARRADRSPQVAQVFVERPVRMRRQTFARRLHLARRRFESAAAPDAAVVSLSPDTIVYKGLFIGAELGDFYLDLQRPDLAVRYAIFHQRFSTNTFPSWRLAQPFRLLAHNGEINTIGGNREQMRGRRHALGGGRWTRQLAAAGPILSEGASDSLSLDEALELLVLAGRRVDEAIAELVPAAPAMVADGLPMSRAVEPWDGPAALVFGDGRLVGARLDRNGLRPAAFSITADGLLVLGSEAGSVAVAAERVVRRGRLGPGEMLVVDTESGGLRHSGAAVSSSPTRVDTPPGPAATQFTPAPPASQRRRIAMGLDSELLRQVIRPMALGGREATWSMGDDTPIAPLASRPRRPTDFLRQSFAQVTNPAIDPERERIVMSLEMDLGRRAAMLSGVDRSHCLHLAGPILDHGDLQAVKERLSPRRVRLLDATWALRDGAGGLSRALDRLALAALRAQRSGAVLVLLSDRRTGPRRAPIPSVLAAGRVHQALVEAGVRPLTDIAVEGGDLFDVHDVAMTMAAGASAVRPWHLLELAAEVAGSRGAEELTPAAASANVLAALEHGLRKVLARMGISTLRSYAGGQCFEVLGLHPELARACFPAAALRPGSVDLSAIGSAILERHAEAYRPEEPRLVDPGLVRYRSTGELHTFAPPVVKALQAMAGVGDSDEAALATYRAATHRPDAALPRDVLELRPAGPELGLDEVEAAPPITARFVSSAMSLGALSPEAHQALAIGMARLGASSNTGEGGEDPDWYRPLPNGDRRESAIKQVASARFGVTTEYLARAEQLEIKIAQGSKPGEGGQLPGRKVTAFIAALRRGQPGMTMISPPPHHDIYSIEDLAQLIGDLRAVNPRARIGVKLVAAAGIGTIAAGVVKAGADYIMVSGHAGGTGASPLGSIKHAGLPWELGLAEVHQVLIRNRLRDRVALRVDGGLQTGRDVLVAALLGAEEYGFGTSALVALGCDMARQCHLDTCPTGIATQRPDLRAKFAGTPEAVVRFFSAIAEDVRRALAELGLRSLREAIGRSDLLQARAGGALEVRELIAAPAWRVPQGRDLRRWVRPARMPAAASVLEAKLLPDILDDLRSGRPHAGSAAITTAERSFGAAIAGELARDPVLGTSRPHLALRLTGSAGQSFGAFAVPEMRLLVEGEANDYVAKGLSGGTVVVRPPAEARMLPPGQAIAGNTCLYGATDGRLHLVGMAGMRFGVRNSGATAVVEGVGAHGCEYMTGGRVVVLGPVGPNFGAGMTGGRAYLYDAHDDEPRINRESVTTRRLQPAADRSEADELRGLVAAHAAEGSARAAQLLADWDAALPRFLVVEPAAEALAGVESSGERERPLAVGSGG